MMISRVYCEGAQQLQPIYAVVGWDVILAIIEACIMDYRELWQQTLERDMGLSLELHGVQAY